ncbi:MAG: hypothetical protein QNL43_07100 [Crocinitomicaceae bacterium]
MQKLFSIILILSLHFGCMGQKVTFMDKMMSKKLIGEGKELFYAGSISEAMLTFRRAKLKNPLSGDACYQLCIAEFHLRSYYDAYNHAIAAERMITKKKDGEYYYYLGRIFQTLNKVDSAKIFYNLSREKLGPRISKDYELDILIDQCDFVKNEAEKGVKYLCKPFSRAVNSKYDEYGAVLIYNKKRLFFTARQPETTGSNINYDDQKFFEDIYRADWDEQLQDWKINIESMEEYNTEGFDALNFVSRNGKYGLLTINTSASIEKTTASSEIYEFEVDEEDSSWYMDPIKSESINTSYFEGAATISDTSFDEDETATQTMVFVSDRKSDKSLTDLYTVQRIDDKWGEAKALDSLNTLGRETTPFLTEDGKFLFFSSDALPGMGGYDVYYSEWLNDRWGAPINLGAAINTVHDDTHFQYFPEYNMGTISSVNDYDGYFSYDLFKIDLSNSNFPFLKK